MENKHQSYDLKQMQSLPLKHKIRMTEQRIQQWYDYWDGNVYISFSGGKDSTVLKHIVDSMGLDMPSVFVNTGLEYPELQKFVKDIKDGKYDCFSDNVEIIRPEKRFDEVIKEYGYPVISKEVSDAVRGAKIYIKKINNQEKPTNYTYMGDFVGCERRLYESDEYVSLKSYKPDTELLPVGVQMLIDTFKDRNGNKSQYNKEKWAPLIESPFLISDQCCDIMKKRPTKKYEKATGRKPILGQMANESRKRKTGWMKTGCNAFDSKRPQSNPMAFWTENDVLEYIKTFDVPYASVYGDIVETGKTIEMAMGEVPELTTTGCKRTGCMFCMFGVHLEKSPNRFERMKETHPKQYDYCMRSVEDGGLGLKAVIDWMNNSCNLNIKY